MADKVAVWRRDNKSMIQKVRDAVTKFDAAVANPATNTLGMGRTCMTLELNAKSALLGHRVPDPEIDRHWRHGLSLLTAAGHVCSEAVRHEDAAMFSGAQDRIHQGVAELEANSLLDQ